MQRRTRNALLGLLFGLLVLIGVEGVLRLTLPPPPPPVRVVSALGERTEYLKSIQGRWSPAYQDASQPLAAETFAVVLGGSSVHGGDPRVVREKEFPDVAGRVTGLVVNNLGAPGLDSFDLVRITEELAKVPVAEGRPQVLVVYAGHNDLGNTRFHRRYGTPATAAGAHMQGFLENFQVYQQLSRLFRPARNARGPGHGEPERPPALSDEAWEKTLAHFEENLTRLVEVAEGVGQRIVFVIPVSNTLTPPADPTCDKTRCPRERYEEGMALVGKDPLAAAELLRDARDADRVALRSPKEIGAAMKTLAAAHPGVSVIDAAATLPRAPGVDVVSREMFSDPIHLSATGHEALGRLVGGQLQDLAAE